jgi:hypothetical protein
MVQLLVKNGADLAVTFATHRHASIVDIVHRFAQPEVADYLISVLRERETASLGMRI